MATSEPQHRDVEHVWSDPRELISARGVGYTVYFILVLAAAIAAIYVDSRFIIAGVAGLVGVAVVLKYPFVGFLIYLCIYFLRPGERFEALAPARTELVYGVLLLVSIVLLDAVRGKGLRFPKDKISNALMAFIVALVVSSIFSEWKQQSMDLVIDFVKTFILYYFLAVLVNSQRRFTITFWLIVGLTAFVGAEAVKNYYTGNYHFSMGVMRAYGATSMGAHPNSLAMYMATNVPLLIYMLVRYKHPFARLTTLAMMGICFLALMITGSRSGVLCIFTIGLTYAWFSKQRVVWMVIIVCVTAATYFALPDQYKARYGTVVDNEVDESTQGRFDAWKAGLTMVAEKPVFGVGPGAFAAAYSAREGVWLSSHSLYIEMLATTGLVGTAAWLFFVVQMIKAIHRAKKLGRANPAAPTYVEVFANALYAVIAGLAIAGVFGHILFRDTWYILAAFVVARQKLLETELPEESRGLA